MDPFVKDDPVFLETCHRWLLFHYHCTDCHQSEETCEYGRVCSYGKSAFSHVRGCSRSECSYPRCDLIKKILRHHQTCKDGSCQVCSPVCKYQARCKVPPPPPPPYSSPNIAESSPGSTASSGQGGDPQRQPPPQHPPQLMLMLPPHPQQQPGMDFQAARMSSSDPPQQQQQQQQQQATPSHQPGGLLFEARHREHKKNMSGSMARTSMSAIDQAGAGPAATATASSMSVAASGGSLTSAPSGSLDALAELQALHLEQRSVSQHLAHQQQQQQQQQRQAEQQQAQQQQHQQHQQAQMQAQSQQQQQQMQMQMQAQQQQQMQQHMQMQMQMQHHQNLAQQQQQQQLNAMMQAQAAGQAQPHVVAQAGIQTPVAGVDFPSPAQSSSPPSAAVQHGLGVTAVAGPASPATVQAGHPHASGIPGSGFSPTHQQQQPGGLPQPQVPGHAQPHPGLLYTTPQGTLSVMPVQQQQHMGLLPGSLHPQQGHPAAATVQGPLGGMQQPHVAAATPQQQQQQQQAPIHALQPQLSPGYHPHHPGAISQHLQPGQAFQAATTSAMPQGQQNLLGGAAGVPSVPSQYVTYGTYVQPPPGQHIQLASAPGVTYTVISHHHQPHAVYGGAPGLQPHPHHTMGQVAQQAHHHHQQTPQGALMAGSVGQLSAAVHGFFVGPQQHQQHQHQFAGSAVGCGPSALGDAAAGGTAPAWAFVQPGNPHLLHLNPQPDQQFGAGGPGGPAPSMLLATQIAGAT